MQRPIEGPLLLLCLDLEAGSTALARHAWEHSRRCNQSVIVLHVLAPGPGAAAAQDRRERLRALLAAVDAEAARLPVEILSGIPDQVIPAHARDAGVGTIVLGRRHRPPVERLYVGSTTSAVICQAPCPVLMVPLSPRSSS